ncbi:nitroreductase [uncultured Piscinibacter sp.]|uniref:nitroreductase family protein n=1 Tax=uncultured Piscinibacter sp. TaxID=1131835 RepID=UPI0026048711|nr:nitroreductase [uncultured Piscinibacter sp.]
MDKRATPQDALRPAPASDSCEQLAAQASVRALIESRHNVSPKRLEEPGPTAAQLHSMLVAAAAAPDHGLLTPWRFILVPADRRHLLAEAFALALIDRDPGATLAQIESAREKAHRAPLLLVAIARLGPREPNVPPLERMVSMGAAIQNLLLVAHAMGFGAGLTSGQAMASPRLHRLCGLSEDEVPVCCISIGTVTHRKVVACTRPLPSDFLSELGDTSATDCLQ